MPRIKTFQRYSGVADLSAFKAKPSTIFKLVLKLVRSKTAAASNFNHPISSSKT